MTESGVELLELLEGETNSHDEARPLTQLAKVSEPPEIEELKASVAAGKLPAWVRERVPYLVGAKEYSDHFGTRELQTKRYRASLSLSIVGNVVLAIALVVLAMSSRAVPYVVQIDKTGYSVVIGPAERVTAADERVLIASTANWIRALRTVLADKTSQRSLVKEVFSMLGANTAANRQAREWLTKQNVLAESTRRVEVEIQRIAPLESGKTFRVEWTEKELVGGTVGKEALYYALVTLSVSPVQRLDEIIANPLGIFVSAYSISKIR